MNLLSGPLVKLIAALAARWPWLQRKINAFSINTLVNVCRHRPHPWSTVHDYVSWTSLTDTTYSARHLPAFGPDPAPPGQWPSMEQVTRLFDRGAGPARYCEKSTCLFPSFAQYLTDGFIRTKMPGSNDPQDMRKRNTSNHQIDMCTLYGRTGEQTDCLREKSEATGRKGRLKSWMRGDEEYPPPLLRDDGTPDPQFQALDWPLGVDETTKPDQSIFAVGGDRVNTTPQVTMMNTLWLREHNRLAGLLERANPSWDDTRVFETARSTVIVEFIKIVVEEYINHISNSPIKLVADPTVAWKAPWNKPNWITTEFSLLYRWHSLIPDEMTWAGRSYKVNEARLNNAPLLAAGLARGFADVSAQRAGRLGAFNTPTDLLAIEQNSVNQGRICRLAPYSDYRAYVSLSRPREFADISEDPKVRDVLKAAYKRPEDVEFYVGLFAEDTIPNSPLPNLVLRMVAVDAFSQALTNPLLSEHVFKESTFSKVGWDAIQTTSRLRDVVDRNCIGGAGTAFIGMTRPDWRPRG